ncbi:transposase [Alphaproteobacteria bacterium]|nr:transposase [Alphaproteobacteria bacterium]
MLMAHKIALDLNDKQATYMARACGAARFAYNWALGEWRKQYAAWKEDNALPKPSQMALRRQLNAMKKTEYPWMTEVTKCAPQLAIMQLGGAFQNFFAKRAKYPTFRKKGVHDRFSISNDQFSVEDSRIRIPHLGWVRMRESLRFTGKVMSATVSCVADRWFVSITVDTLDAHPPLPEAENESQDKNQVTGEFRRSQNQGAVGVDLGVKALATLSTEEPAIPSPKVHKALLGRVRSLSRSLSRKVKGSHNRAKAKAKLSRLHARIACIRQDAMHKLTSDLTRRFHTIGIEDLNVQGMMKNRHLARSIADMSFFEFRRQLEYKADMRGGQIVVADRWFASSKTCSVCGHKLEELPLSVRDWTCPECQTHHDRDKNAAKNLENNAVSSTVSACGGEGSGSRRKTKTKPAPMKQEANSIFNEQV